MDEYSKEDLVEVALKVEEYLNYFKFLSKEKPHMVGATRSLENDPIKLRNYMHQLIGAIEVENGKQDR